MSRPPMQTMSRSVPRARNRAAFTILELLVTCAVIGILAALLLPAVMRSRDAAQRTQCKSNLRNLAVAMLAEADTRRRFAASGNIGAELPQGTPYHSWVVDLLPGIDQAQIHTQWDFNTAFNAAPNQGLARTPIPVLTCPSDISLLGGTGDLSYVVNGGFGWTAPVDCPEFTHSGDPSGPFTGSFDLNGNGIVCTPPDEPDGDPSDRDLFKQTGLFFAENWPHGSGTVRYHAPGGIHDGSSQTLLIAENVRAGADPANADANWANPDPWRTSFFVSAYVCQDAVCSDGNVDYARANARTNVPYRFESINAGRTQPEGEAPWPSSFHVGGVHVAYADGHVVFLSENIDGVVYAALVSPQGARIEGPLAQPVINTTGF